MTDSRLTEPAPRRRLLLDPGWRFHRGDLAHDVSNTHQATYESVKVGLAGGAAAPGFDDSGWREVDLPHDFVVEGTFDPEANVSHGFLPAGVGWYRKHFTLPAQYEGRRLSLVCDGAFRHAELWFNGHWLGRHASGYTGFRFDLSDAAQYGGPNLLAVRVDASCFEGWWYEGGGLYRHVWLEVTDPLHVAPEGVFVIAEPSEDFSSASVTVRTEVVNAGPQAACVQVESLLLDPAGQTVGRMACGEEVPAGATRTFVQGAELAQPRLWSVHEPHLYRTLTRVWEGERPADGVQTTWGVRSFRWDADHGFFLNGRPLKLLGTCNHQDHAGVGVAVPDRVNEWRIARLKEMGCNAYRSAHHPPTPELLEACDRLGMLVMAENRYLSSATEHVEELRFLIRRDRNHPSVCLWSLANEEHIQGTPAGTRVAHTLRREILRLDPTRAITMAQSGAWGEAGFSGVLDVMGFNYNVAGYDDYRARFPHQPTIATETTSAFATRGQYRTDERRGYLSSYDLNAAAWGNTAEQGWRAVAERPWLAGLFIWTGFDYRGEPTPCRWPCISSHFGILDTCGFPKDSFYYYRAWWTAEPVLHLFPHWNWPGREGEPIPVWAYSNCEQVELLLNGESLGAQPMPRNGHLEWQVPYRPGELCARGFSGGRQVAEGRVVTTGAPWAVRLRPDRAELRADGEDVSLVEVAVVDEQGRVVPVADNEVRFRIEGPGRLLGVGNGDPTSHEPDPAEKAPVFAGLAQTLVGTRREPGEIVLRAESPGLRSAQVTLAAHPATPRPWL